MQEKASKRSGRSTSETVGRGRPLGGNLAIASKLRDYADLLQQQGEDGFRTKAYRRAADEVAELPRPLSEIVAKEGTRGLIALPAIGRSIAAAIAEMVLTGRWAQLERLRGELSPEALFQTLPGIGPKLAEELVEEDQLETLEDLETALQLGTLRAKGIGPRRRRMLVAGLAERLGRAAQGREPPPDVQPAVSLILQVDRIYREKASRNELRKIAPKRLNPRGEAWLPILHASHDDWHFTALFSNTRLAHQLGRTNDWVVIYFHRDDLPEGRCTVVTETRGPLAGRRVVRGREQEQQMELTGSR